MLPAHNPVPWPDSPMLPHPLQNIDTLEVHQRSVVPSLPPPHLVTHLLPPTPVLPPCRESQGCQQTSSLRHMGRSMMLAVSSAAGWLAQLSPHHPPAPAQPHVLCAVHIREYTAEHVRSAVFNDKVPVCHTCGAVVKPNVVFLGVRQRVRMGDAPLWVLTTLACCARCFVHRAGAPARTIC